MQTVIKEKLRNSLTGGNPIAKNMPKFNRPKVFKDRKKEQKNKPISRQEMELQLAVIQGMA